MQESEILQKAIGVTGTVGDINTAIGRSFPTDSGILLPHIFATMKSTESRHVWWGVLLYQSPSLLCLQFLPG